MFVNLFFIIRKNEIKYIMHDPHWGHGGHKAWVCSCAQRLDTTLLISRLALRAHNLISQLTLYDTPRPTKQKMQSNSIRVENETEPKTKPNPTLFQGLKQSYKLSSALAEVTGRGPRT